MDNSLPPASRPFFHFLRSRTHLLFLLNGNIVFIINSKFYWLFLGFSFILLSPCHIYVVGRFKTHCHASAVCIIISCLTHVLCIFNYCVELTWTNPHLICNAVNKKGAFCSPFSLAPLTPLTPNPPRKEPINSVFIIQMQ